LGVCLMCRAAHGAPRPRMGGARRTGASRGCPYGMWVSAFDTCSHPAVGGVLGFPSRAEVGPAPSSAVRDEQAGAPGRRRAAQGSPDAHVTLALMRRQVLARALGHSHGLSSGSPAVVVGVGGGVVEGSERGEEHRACELSVPWGRVRRGGRSPRIWWPVRGRRRRPGGRRSGSCCRRRP
jgi:hypothetical protein